MVEEKPSVGGINISGNKVIDTSKLMEKIGIDRGATFNESMIKQITQKITQEYHNKGYFYVRVQVDSSISKDNQVIMVFSVNEGRKVRIRKILFSGNKALKDSKLSGVMEVVETSWFSFIDDSGIYKKDALKIDLLRIESLYHDHGYLKVRVLEPIITLDKNLSLIHI